MSWLCGSFKYNNNLRRNRGGPFKTEPTTNLSRWRLKTVNGRQTWHYIADDETPEREQSLLEKHCLGVDITSDTPTYSKATTAAEASLNAAQFYCKLQADDGHWAGDYGGPLFLMPGLVIACYVTETHLEPEQKLEMIRYLRSVQCPDGGWGLHTEGPPTVFGCALNYVTMRLLGVSADDPDLLSARKMLSRLGGALAIPSWGKFWLAIMNLYSWNGMHSLLPEMWIFPKWIPVHPSKMWCHCRQVLLGMAYCYGCRISVGETPLILQLRKELYVEPYESINWSVQKDNVSDADLYTPHSWLMLAAYYIADWYEMYHISSWRQKAIDEMYEHICADDEFTDGISIGPVSKVIQMIARWHSDGSQHPAFKRHQNRVRDYLWLGLDGMKMTGTNGSQLWDTAFALQALLECGAEKRQEFDKCITLAYSWLDATQMKANPQNYEKYYRQMSKGGFPFSTRECGWIVADCTAEGLKTLLLLQKKCPYLPSVVSSSRLQDAVDVLLSMKNDDGGYATYETRRGGAMLELLNASEVFGDIMIDYTYVECTSAVMQALKLFTEEMPNYRADEIQHVLNDGLQYVIRNQRIDGSWYGSWGVCFTYGAYFGLEAFACMGHTYKTRSPYQDNIERACSWLVQHQLSDGGWGENFEACEQKEYVAADKSQTVNTAWALLGLMAVRYPDVSVLEKAVHHLISSQLENGDFSQENIMGVFNKSCAIHYESYRNVFPIWALGRFAHLYPDHPLATNHQ